MNDLTSLLRLEGAFTSAGISLDERGFEEAFVELAAKPNAKSIAQEVEDRIRSYFSDLRLPSEPTLYDHLVLSLREKDVVATFNWDPLLWQACWRNRRRAKLPRSVFLHGNVAVGYCLKCRVKGTAGTTCVQCGDGYADSRLLYPITTKNYTADPIISGEWKDLQTALRGAYVVTIFGYSAPKSDVEAVELMRVAWGRKEERNLEQFELIDIRPEDDIRQSWNDFIHTHHYGCVSDFYSSLTARYPRRSCESVWACVMEMDPFEEDPIPHAAADGFDEIDRWLKPYVQAEAAPT